MNFIEKIARHLFGGSKNRSLMKSIYSRRFLLFASLIVLLVMFIYFPGTLVGTLGTILNFQNFDDALFSGVFTFASYHDCVASFGNPCKNTNACGTTGSLGFIQCDGSCSGSTPAVPYTVDDTCNRNSCGGTGTITDACTGTCSASPPFIYTVGDTCNRNSCGGTGTITDQCTGACSASAPTVYTVGAACNRNSCGGTGTITDACTGACSASPPTIYTLGESCTSSPNACDETNGTITDSCSGTCTAPSNPSTCANNVGEAGYQCSSGCTAPADRVTSCRGGAGGSLSSGVNSGSFPEYYGINNAWNNVACGPSSTYSCPVGSTTNVYLQYSTETNYDFVKIYNGAGSLLEQFSGSSGYVWKGPYAVSSLQFGFTSDSSVPGSNFDIWKVECVAPADATVPSVSANNASNSWFSSRTTTLSVSDAGGVNQARYNWDSNPMNAGCTSGGTTFTNGVSLTVSAGSHRLYLCARDNAGLTNTWDSGADQYRVDATKPASAISPAPSAWQRAGFTVSVSDTDTGGSGFFAEGGRYHVFERIPAGSFIQTVNDAQRTLTSSTPVIPVGSGITNGCSKEGSQTCQVQVFARDQAGNTGDPAAEGDFVTVNIDYTAPSVGLISPINAVTNIATTLSAAVSDGVSGIDYCELVVGGVIQTGIMILSGTPVASASKSHTFTVSGTYPVHATCYDKAGNPTIGTDASVVVGVPSLTFPSGTWQRLWYATSGASPTFTASNFLGEGPNESVEQFTKDWDGDNTIIAHGTPNNIGFKSSRTINFPFASTYRFTIGSDDGIRLFLDEAVTPFCNQWSNDGYRTKSCDVSISPAGNHKFELDYYENTGNAKVSFSYELAPCTKSSDDLHSSTSATVNTAVATKPVPITITHTGSDNDGSGVIFQFNGPLAAGGQFGTPPSGAQIQMDDQPVGAGDCDDDLVWDTRWEDPTGNENLRVYTNTPTPSFSGSHSLSFGFSIFMDSAVIKSTGARTASRSGTISGSGDPITFSAVSALDEKYEIVECTTNAHCTPGSGSANSDANASKAYCNGGATRTTSNFPLNTCIDSVAPTSKITNISSTPGFAIGVPVGAVSAFLKADNNGDTPKVYNIVVEDVDTGSGLDKCLYSINGGATKERTCGGLSLKVGKPGAVGNLDEPKCTTEGRNQCKIKVWATDKAGNTNAVTERIVGDTEVFSTTIEKDQSEYNDFTKHPLGFNVFWFGVDWTPPTAQ